MQLRQWARALLILLAAASFELRAQSKPVICDPALWARVAQVHTKNLQELINEVQRQPGLGIKYFLPKTVSAMNDEDWQNLATASLQTKPGVNVTFRAVDKSGRSVAIVKYVRGSHDVPILALVPEVERGGLGKREVLAYALDQRVSFGLVPKTVFGRGADGKLFTLQQFMHGMKPAAEVKDFSKVSRADAQKMSMFDLLVGSYDRHIENWMVGEDGKIALIDNGSSFIKFRKSQYARPLADWKRLPQANGQIDEQLAQQMLGLSEEEFTKILDAYQIPASAKQLALSRLSVIHEGIKAHVALEDLIDGLAIRSSARPYVVLVGGVGAAAGGLVWAVEKSRPTAKQPER